MDTTDKTRLPKNVTRPLGLAVATLLLLATSVAVWSVLAELVTTLRVPGFLSSATPSYAIQSPQRGMIGLVRINQFDPVDPGDILFEFDRNEERIKRNTLAAQKSEYEFENRNIELLLGSSDETPVNSSLLGQIPNQEFKLRLDLQRAKLAALQEQADQAKRERAVIEDEIATLREIQKLLDQRRLHLDQLVRKGATAVSELNEFDEKLLNLKARLNAKSAQIVNREGVIRQAGVDARSLVANESHDLASRFKRNTAKLNEITGQIDRLDHLINAGTIRAPVGGTITSLIFDTPQSFANAGEVLATISQPLAAPTIELRVPVHYVDQVLVGQTGQVQLSSLPQRELPPLEITITAVSAQAVLDREDTPLYYPAKARFSAQSLETAKSALGERFRLSLDMPLTATLTGRSTTLISFLIRPLKAMRGSAFED